MDNALHLKYVRFLPSFVFPNENAIAKRHNFPIKVHLKYMAVLDATWHLKLLKCLLNIKKYYLINSKLHVYPVLVIFIFFGVISILCQVNKGHSMGIVLAMFKSIGDSWTCSLSTRVCIYRGPSSIVSMESFSSTNFTYITYQYKTKKLTQWFFYHF